MSEEILRKLLMALTEAHEKAHLEIIILYGMAQKYVPNYEEKMRVLRLDQYLYGVVHSRFEPLYNLLRSGADEQELLEALKDIPEPKKPN